MKITKEFKIGATIILGALLLILGIQYLKGKALFGSTKTFYGIYAHVSGLTPNNPVTVNGFKVGQVTKINLLDHRAGTVLVTFTVDQKDFEFPDDTEARIQSMDLLGSKTLALVLGQSMNMATNGDTLHSAVETDLMNAVSEEMRPIKAKTEKLLGTIDSVMTVTEELLRVDARPNLAASFESIRRTLASIENTSSNLDGLLDSEKSRLSDILTNLETITSQISQNSNGIGNAINNFAAISDTLAEGDIGGVLRDASHAVNQVAGIMEQINSGHGSLGLLIYNDSLYNNLTAAANTLDKLQNDVIDNPKKYVHFSLFGKTGKRKLSEKDKEEIIQELKKD